MLNLIQSNNLLTNRTDWRTKKVTRRSLRTPILYLYENLYKRQERLMKPDQEALLVLLSRIKERDEVAMGELYDALVNRVYGLAIKIVLKPELAEEVVGDAFMQVWKKVKDFDSSKASPVAWILMICRSRALDKLRRERPELNKNIYELDQANTQDKTTVTPYTELQDIDISCRVHEALQLLNEKQRQLITLAFYQDLSQSEISELTGEPIGTVKSNIRRAQLILRETLSREDFSHGGNYGKA